MRLVACDASIAEHALVDFSLQRLHVRGFMSLRDLDFHLGPVTVMIGSNGSGKSNILSVVEMLCHMRAGALGRYLVDHGPASTLLHYGSKVTPVLDIGLDFGRENGAACYEVRLGHTPGNDSFVYLSERVGWLEAGHGDPMWFDLGAGHRESEIDREFDGIKGSTVRNVRHCLGQMRFHHFHDTSPRSDLRSSAREEDARTLHAHGKNLAAVLLALAESGPDTAEYNAWRRINHLVRRIAPSIGTLAPTRTSGGMVRLDWRDDRGEVFSTNRLSDGALRAIALITALSQPVERLPRFITIDEPELGLHPAALGVLAGLIRSTASRAQVLLATQSPTLLDGFDAGDVAIVERSDNATVVRRLDADGLADWLEDFRLSDLYDRNLLGGRP